MYQSMPYLTKIEAAFAEAFPNTLNKLREEFVDMNDLSVASKWELVDLGLTRETADAVVKFFKDHKATFKGIHDNQFDVPKETDKDISEELDKIEQGEDG